MEFAPSGSEHDLVGGAGDHDDTRGATVDQFSATSLLLRALGAFLVGSIPASNLIARWRSGLDLRTIGTGTVSATNVYRAAGMASFVVASALDVSKGVVAVLLMRPHGHLAVALGAGLTVIGHNWSFCLRGAGGRGVLPSLGALLIAAPAGGVLLLGAVLLGRLAGDTAPACFVVQLALTPFLATTHGIAGALLGLALSLPMVVKRLLGNASPPRNEMPRVYARRLLYDRDLR